MLHKSPSLVFARFQYDPPVQQFSPLLPRLSLPAHFLEFPKHEMCILVVLRGNVSLI
jgi:hypothetical protein